MTDPDIVAVRELPPGVAEPTDESVSRTWHGLTRLQAGRPAQRRRWVPVAAALVVAGVAGGGVTVLSDRGAGPAVEVGTAPSAPAPTPPPPSGKGTDPSAGGASNETITPEEKAAYVGPSKPISAPQAIERLATAAAGSPTATVGTGQVVYVRLRGFSAVRGIGEVVPGNEPAAPADMWVTDDREIWLWPEGMTAAATRRFGSTAPGVGTSPSAVDKPSIWQPTPAWLAALPTDPAALRAELLAGIGDNAKWSADHLLAKEIGELLVSSEPLLTADVRVAMLEVIKGWEGLSARETVIDGRQVWAIRQTEQGRFDEILFDPATGRAVGRASGIDGTLDHQALWTHKIVEAPGER
ncbi:hypothetical protein O7635_16885 [Asanoa sp. WMMD1127]|uniref:hypothetical protein n=1 Tax=Asanoa sp. WMMD1127 TaxID=3016107 RepID=UPI002415B979|nr:hypothetical protein [Asanoa sp. WMMD1127]MDG4823530.1 hypothetical protein [Asanoa sp. WMMD1127]